MKRLIFLLYLCPFILIGCDKNPPLPESINSLEFLKFELEDGSLDTVYFDLSDNQEDGFHSGENITMQGKVCNNLNLMNIGNINVILKDNQDQKPLKNLGNVELVQLGIHEEDRDQCFIFEKEIDVENLYPYNKLIFKHIYFDELDSITEEDIGVSDQFKINTPPHDVSVKTDKSLYDYEQKDNIIVTITISDTNGINDINKVELLEQVNNSQSQSLKMWNNTEIKSFITSFDNNKAIIEYQTKVDNFNPENYIFTVKVTDNSGEKVDKYTQFKINSNPEIKEFSIDKNTYILGEDTNINISGSVYDKNPNDIKKIEIIFSQNDQEVQLYEINKNELKSADGNNQTFNFNFSGKLAQSLKTGQYQYKIKVIDESDKYIISPEKSFTIEDKKADSNEENKNNENNQ